jgi:putative ATPase
MDLFQQQYEKNLKNFAPLPDRMRPHSFDEFVGQDSLVTLGKPLRQAIENDNLHSMIFWGPPGSGKTTLAQIIAAKTESNFVFFRAVTSGIPELRQIIQSAQDQLKFHKKRTVLFVDEIHRLNKAQQDAFLPYVEEGVFILIGATTENPSFEVIRALLSRVQVYVLDPLSEENIRVILERALADKEKGLGEYTVRLEEKALDWIIRMAHGDTRIALNSLETAVLTTEPNTQGERVLSLKRLEEVLGHKALGYDKSGEEHYNVISAFIKSLRGSDPDAALYYLARMLEAGEDPLFIARRMVILASEDIGNADPQALLIAIATMQAVQFVGLPEARLNLAQAVTYLATAPKSNASYIGLEEALADVKQNGALPIPLHIRNAPTSLMKDLGYGKGYKYAHDYEGSYVEQDYLPETLRGHRYYRPSENGYEQEIQKRLNSLRKENDHDPITK